MKGYGESMSNPVSYQGYSPEQIALYQQQLRARAMKKQRQDAQVRHLAVSTCAGAVVGAAVGAVQGKVWGNSLLPTLGAKAAYVGKSAAYTAGLFVLMSLAMSGFNKLFNKNQY